LIRGFVSEERATPATRLAATVLLVRDRDGGGIEVFMEERHIRSDFVGGAYVFPGGGVDPDDRLPAELCAGRTDQSASRLLGIEHGGLAFFVAAIRECFEEAGVLLAYDRSGALLDFTDAATEDRFRDWRDRLNSSAATLLDIAREEELRLATDRIHYWGHWLTPEGQPRRYDTRFFLAEAPANQTATHDDWELTASAWVRPDEALERAQRREWMIIFPTLWNLRELGRFERAIDATAWAADAERGRPLYVPRVSAERVVLPGDAGYDQAQRDTSGADPAFWFRSFFSET
jgi:8-oxo-dGTP pyrophosphatase MutT (NUDIX family)